MKVEMIECEKCKVSGKMTEMCPLWDLLGPVYPPKYLCKSCQPNINKRFGRCKNCSELYEKNLSQVVCDECFPKCVSIKPLNCQPK